MSKGVIHPIDYKNQVAYKGVIHPRYITLIRMYDAHSLNERYEFLHGGSNYKLLIINLLINGDSGL